MRRGAYTFARLVARFVRNQCVVEFVLNRRRLDRAGGFVLASTHISHLEPAIISCHARRPIRWIARVEFYVNRFATAALTSVGALPIDRAGRSVRTIRRAIELARGGEIVGIFPDGGVLHGAGATYRGGAPKGGACLIACRARVPIVPAVVLGTERLTAIGPWLPAKRARLWIAYGEAVEPPPATMPRRAARFEMAERLRAEFQRTYAELLARSGLTDADVP